MSLKSVGKIQGSTVTGIYNMMAVARIQCGYLVQKRFQPRS